MLIGQRLDKIEKSLNELTQTQDSTLYIAIEKELKEITQNLAQDIKKVEKQLENKITLDNKEYQDLTSTWIKNELNELKPQIKSNLDKKADEVLSNLSQSITQSINRQIADKIKQATENLHTQIDLKQIINNIKNTPSLISEIKQNTQKELNTQLQATLPELKESSKNQLIQKLSTEVDLNKCIKIALETQTLNNELKQEIKNKSAELIQEYLKKDNLQNDLKQNVENIKQGFLTFINLQKQNAMDLTNEKITDLDSYFNTTKETLKQRLANHKSELEKEQEAQKEAIKVIMDEFSEYIKNYESEVIEKIIKNITNDLNNNDLHNRIYEDIYNEGLSEILKEKETLENHIIQEACRLFIDSITKEAFLNAILQDEGIINRLESLSIELINEKLTHALIKDYVAESLKEKAKEILKSDELIRAEAEAQAHLCAMQQQSNLASITEIIESLKQEQDYTAQLQELAQALSEAKDELKQELAQTTLSDKMQTLITDALTKDLENLKADIKTETIDLITQLQDTQKALIQSNTDEIQKLKEKLKQIQDRPQSNGNNDFVDNKTLATT